MIQLVVSNILYHCGNFCCQHTTNICTISQKEMLQTLYMLPNIHGLPIKVLLPTGTGVSQEEPHRSQWSCLRRNEIKISRCITTKKVLLFFFFFLNV